MQNLDTLSVYLYSTNKLIHREASKIFSGENRFRDCFDGDCFPMGSPPWVTNLMRNIKISMNMEEVCWEGDSFFNDMRYFGDISIIRRSLKINFCFTALYMHSLEFFIPLPRRFTNFEAIELYFFHDGGVITSSPYSITSEPLWNPGSGMQKILTT